ERDDGRRHAFRVSDRDLGRADAQGLRAVERPAPKLQKRLAAGVTAHVDLLEGDAAPSGAERLHCGLLGGEASRHVFREGSRMAPSGQDFPREKDAIEKPLSVALEQPGHAGDFGQVEAEEQVLHRPKKRAMRSASGRGSSAIATAPRLASYSPAAWRRRFSM